MAKYVAVVCFLSLFVCVIDAGVIERGSPIEREKRSLYQMGVMVDCAIDSGIFYGNIKYNGYGCYCGFGGHGVAVDETDSCCEVQDECYQRQIDLGICSSLQIYTILYDYGLENCGTKYAKITCKSSWEYGVDDVAECRAEVCECDKAMAECFARNDATYDHKYRNYDSAKC